MYNQWICVIMKIAFYHSRPVPSPTRLVETSVVMPDDIQKKYCLVHTEMMTLECSVN